VAPGTSPTGDQSKCIYCHASYPTSLANGQFHASIASYSGPGAPLPKPAACADCHAQMRPTGIVEWSG